jgi:hypothetical protein
MTTTRRQPVQRLRRSNALKNLHGIINTSELNDDEKNEIYDLLVKELGIELENITQGHKFHSSCIHRWCETNNNCPMCRTCNPIGLMERPTTPTGNTGENINYYYNNFNNINNYINNINRNYNENIINHIENNLYVNNYNTNMNYMRHSD